MKHLPFLTGQSEMSGEPSIITKCQLCPQYYKGGYRLQRSVLQRGRKCPYINIFFITFTGLSSNSLVRNL